MRAGFRAAGRDAHWQTRAVDGTEDFGVRDVEFAQTRVRGVLGRILLLRLRRQRLAHVLSLVGQRAVLRRQQQGCQRQLQQSAFHAHRVMPVCERPGQDYSTSPRRLQKGLVLYSMRHPSAPP